MDFLSICRNLRHRFPKPIKPSILEEEIQSLDGESKKDAVKSIFSFWKRDGWVIKDDFAVHLSKDEEFFAHSRGLTLVKQSERPDRILIKLLPLNVQIENKVIWFKDE
jgi:hypothetical protein